ncbi:MAG: rhodanese-like domain-containing protein [Chitinophagales bacterium]|nr:rhodanese-like domain-containing protein [Chitinophagales bacterium]
MLGFLKSLFAPKFDAVLDQKMKSTPFLVDVRTPMEYSSGHPKGAVNIPLSSISSNLSKFKNKKNIILFCRSGNRSGQAASILKSNGISDVYNGGSWQNVNRYLQS